MVQFAQQNPALIYVPFTFASERRTGYLESINDPEHPTVRCSERAGYSLETALKTD